MNGISPNRINKALQKLKEAEKELTDALAEAERPTPDPRPQPAKMRPRHRKRPRL
jgi:hypothetical protein